MRTDAESNDNPSGKPTARLGRKASLRDFARGLRKAPALFVGTGIPVTLLGVAFLKLQELHVSGSGFVLMAATVFLAVRLILFPPALVDGRRSLVEALLLSWRLGKGHGMLLVGLAMVFCAEVLVLGVLIIGGLRAPVVGLLVPTLMDWFAVIPGEVFLRYRLSTGATSTPCCRATTWTRSKPLTTCRGRVELPLYRQVAPA